MRHTAGRAWGAVLAVALAAQLGAFAVPSAIASGRPALAVGPDVAPGSLLARPQPGREADLRALAASLDAVAGDRLPGGFLAVSVNPARSASLEARLRSSPIVAEVEADQLRRLSQTPDDPGYSKEQAPYLEAVRLPEAWDVTTGSDGLVIAIVDSGVDRNHPDLAGRLLPGRDFVDADPPDDQNGHGTMMAGIAAATTGNAVGVAGVAWRAKILPVRVLDKNGLGSDSQVAQGIAWAAKQGADVINLSFGGPVSSRVLEAAIQDAVAQGVVVVAAAGNQGSSRPTYPAALPGVVAVSAIGSDGGIASFSNWGWWIDLAAPGVDVAGPWWPGSGYATGSGTSHASALVAGVAVLARASDPTAPPAQIVARLRAGARDVGPFGIDPFYGSGIVDALSAVGGGLPTPSPVAPLPGGDVDGAFDRALPLTGTVRATLTPEGDVDWYSLEVTDPAEIGLSVDPPPRRADWSEINPVLSLYGPDGSLLGEADQSGDSQTESLRVSADRAGIYRLAVRNANGATSSDPYTLRAEQGSPVSDSVPGATLWLADRLPADLAADAPTNSVPRMRFVRPLDPASVPPAVELLDAGTGAPVSAAVEYDRAGWVSLRPRAALTPAAAYLVRVSGRLTDSKGTEMEEDLGFRFVVGASSDERPPETMLSSAPGRQGGAATAAFVFEADEQGVSFECSLDDSGFGPCTSPATYRGLSAGAHRFATRGSDAAGNTDPSPAEWSFSVSAPLAPTPSEAPGAAPRSGYWMLAADGAVFAFGGARHRGDPRGWSVVDLEASRSGDGYWVVDEAGRVRSYGDARYLGGLGAGALAPTERVTSLAATPDGNGYWIFTSAGRAVPFGGARSFGDLSALALNGPILDSVATPTGGGYWLVGSDGGVFAFGDARFLGSMGGKAINAPVRSLVPAPSGAGYWLVGSDGGVFAFGDAPFRGSMGGKPLNRPVTGMVAFGSGYLMAGSDGGVFNFSDRPFHGSLGSNPPQSPIVALAAYAVDSRTA